MAGSFLHSIAEYYTRGSASQPCPRDLIFVVPNKRSLLFLKEEYKTALSAAYRAGRGPKVVPMPRFRTIQEVIGELAGVPVADSRELVFILFKAYLEVISGPGERPKKRDFESFVFWGNIILSDFDDVDRAMVNAEELFTNLRRVTDIKAFYLNDRQIQAIESVWGEGTLKIDTSDDSEHVRFWKHVDYGSDDPKKALNRNFAQFWQILFEIYEAYHRELNALGVTSAGMQFRRAAERIESQGAGEIGRGHYVFVGFNDLSHAETLIFKRLQELGKASFFWDEAPLRMFGADDPAKSPGAPLDRLRRLVRTFRMPDDYGPSLPEGLPSVTVTAVPSNIAQAKALNKLLTDNMENYRLGESGVLSTAVVLPDAGLLLPTVMSVPAGVKALNITMGLSYRSTTFAAMLHAIVRLHLNSSVSASGKVTFYYKDVLNFLQQPHIMQIARTEAKSVSDRIVAGGVMRIDSAVLCRDTSVLSNFFAPVAACETVGEVSSYLIDLLAELQTDLENYRDEMNEALAEGNSEGRKRTIKLFETEAIAFFRNEIVEFDKLLRKYDIDLAGKRAARTVFRIFERLFSHRGLSVNGTPVEGLQVLGVLETRSLDFENVAFLSMNEGVFPRVNYSRTMIPATLRTCFHLPDFQSLEWTYAYCFYRLIARARNVELFYDSRNDGQGNGEESRYIRQLANLVPGLKIKERRVVFPTSNIRVDSISLPKNALHNDRIDQLRYDPGRKRPRLSASAIETFKSCGLRFYLQYVMGIRDEDVMTGYVDASQQGQIVHRSIQNLFDALGRGSVITRATYDRWLDPKSDVIVRSVEDALAVVRHHNPEFSDFDVEERLLIRKTAETVYEDLCAERDFYCAGGQTFTYVGSEMKFDTDADGNEVEKWDVAPGLTVRFTMSVDRVDRLPDGTLRFIDFKTGTDETVLPDALKLIDPAKDCYDGVLQLLIYSDVHLDRINPRAKIIPVVHNMRDIALGKPIGYVIPDGDHTYNCIMDKPGQNYRDVIHGLVRRIFDSEGVLGQAEDDSACTFCYFKTVCGRFPKSW